MAGIFITTATGKALEDQISLMDKLTNEWTMRAARGECAWICSDCCVMFPDGMPDACAHDIQQCTSIITRDKMSARKQGAKAMTTNTNAALAEDLQDTVSKALRRAWQLGQTYWQQADSEYTSQHRKADETQGKFDALVEETRAALSTAAQPTGEPVAYLWQHSETGRTRVVMPDGVITADATWHVVGPLVLAAAPKAAPAPDLELTDAQIFDIAADPATCPAPPWWHRDEVAVGDVRKAVLAFARAIIRASRGQAPAPAAVAPQNPPMPETWHVDVHVHGEKILSIGYDWLSGKGDLTESEEQAVVGMAQHLLSFVGYGLPQSGFDPDADEQAPAAQRGEEDAARANQDDES